MRSFVVSLALCLAAPLLMGCTVMDELNASSELMDSMTAGSQEAVAEEGDPAAPPDPLQASKDWWKGARSIGTGKVDQKIVSCQLPGGRTQFMKRPQCLASRGTPTGV